MSAPRGEGGPSRSEGPGRHPPYGRNSDRVDDANGANMLDKLVTPIRWGFGGLKKTV
jgi:hypothetical protein